jgi:two-component system LytT family sensor kinase
MNALNAALLVNLVGFTVGIALYALLGTMVIQHRDRAGGGISPLLLLTACLGLLWNIGELFVFVERDFGFPGGWPFVSAAAYSALGFLPSVVVHSVRIGGRKQIWLASGAYTLSSIAAIFHFWTAFSGDPAPSDFALRTLTYGSLVLTAALLVFAFRETLESKTIWAAALLIFAVSGLHLSGDRAENSWLVEMVAHQSSLPLALAILYQNYRFAFADLFLKRSISLLLIALVAFGLYMFVAAPLLRYHESHDRNDVQAVSLIITLWIATALVYPAIHKFAVWLVDTVVLQRPDYAELQVSISAAIEKCESAEELLDVVGARLAAVLTADRSSSREAAVHRGAATDLVSLSKDGCLIYVPTTDRPAYEIGLEGFHGGRRLLSDETAMLEGVALIASRRIDAMRVLHERCDREFREQEFSKLATEAQLAALRAQINPHFLFNALTTIGYLIQTAPDKAFETLLHLTKLLRGVLNASSEFCTVADELKLIESYLDIERARFEERLDVTIDVPPDLRVLVIPSLILQPLVENSIKHGISENKKGGKVKISASLVVDDGGEFLELCVADSGAGRASAPVERRGGVGLKNVRERLRSHYGARSDLSLEQGGSAGTSARIRLPVSVKPSRAVAKTGNR